MGKNKKEKKLTKISKAIFLNNFKWTMLVISLMGLIAFAVVGAIALANVSEAVNRIKINNLGYGLILFVFLSIVMTIWVYLTKPNKKQHIVVLDDDKIVEMYQKQTNEKIADELKELQEDSNQPSWKQPSKDSKLDAKHMLDDLEKESEDKKIESQIGLDSAQMDNDEPNQVVDKVIADIKNGKTPNIKPWLNKSNKTIDKDQSGMYGLVNKD